MADGTHIQWSDATWNIITGCSVTSPGCTNCYAMRLAGTRLQHHPSRVGLTEPSKAGPVWTGEVRFNEEWLDQPIRWQRPRKIFVCAHGDLFHENVPDEWIDRVFAVMALCPQHTFQVLTKRADRMLDYISPDWRQDEVWAHARKIVILNELKKGAGFPTWPLPNVWLGVSVEDQRAADARIPHLLATPAAKHFISAEPLLSPVDLRWIAEPDDDKDGVIDALLGCNWIEHEWGEEFRPVRPGHQDRVMRRRVCSSEADILANRKLDWVICGGESGPGARNPDFAGHARALRDQCASAGVKFFGKQDFGGKPMPADLDITEFPQ